MSTFNGSIALKDFHCLNESTFLGMASLECVDGESIYAQGSVAVDTVTIRRSVRCQGPLKGRKLKCSTLQVHGEVILDDLQTDSLEILGRAELYNAKVGARTHLSGDAIVKNSILNGIVLHTRKAEFSNCQINSITVEKDSSIIYPPSKNMLVLSNGTQILGDIIFKSEGAELHIDTTVTIKGKIINAKIITA